MLVERAMHRYVVQSLEADRQGGLAVGHKVLVDDLCGSHWDIAVQTAVTRIAMVMIHRKGFNGIP